MLMQLPTYAKEYMEMQTMSREEYLASLRRRSSGFSRGVSKYRGVARHHHNGRWEARIGRVLGNKYLYLGTFSTISILVLFFFSFLWSSILWISLTMDCDHCTGNCQPAQRLMLMHACMHAACRNITCRLFSYPSPRLFTINAICEYNTAICCLLQQVLRKKQHTPTTLQP